MSGGYTYPGGYSQAGGDCLDGEGEEFGKAVSKLPPTAAELDELKAAQSSMYHKLADAGKVIDASSPSTPCVGGWAKAVAILFAPSADGTVPKDPAAAKAAYERVLDESPTHAKALL